MAVTSSPDAVGWFLCIRVRLHQNFNDSCPIWAPTSRGYVQLPGLPASLTFWVAVYKGPVIAPKSSTDSIPQRSAWEIGTIQWSWQVNFSPPSAACGGSSALRNCSHDPEKPWPTPAPSSPCHLLLLPSYPASFSLPQPCSPGIGPSNKSVGLTSSSAL